MNICLGKLEVMRISCDAFQNGRCHRENFELCNIYGLNFGSYWNHVCPHEPLFFPVSISEYYDIKKCCRPLKMSCFHFCSTIGSLS